MIFILIGWYEKNWDDREVIISIVLEFLRIYIFVVVFFINEVN